MATSNAVYEDVQFLCNKYQHGYIAPDEFVLTFNKAQRILMNRLLKMIQEYQPGRPVARTATQMTQPVEEMLSPFTEKATLTISAGVGDVNAQFTTFLKQLSLNTTTGKRIRRLKHEQIHSATNSAIDPPSGTNPYYYETEAGYHFLSGADTLTSAIITYVREPLDITWPYTVVDGVPTYNPGGSPVNPEWRNAEIDELIMIQLGLIGIHLKDGDLIRMSQTSKQQGD